jgi:hypothetical protein
VFLFMLESFMITENTSFSLSDAEPHSRFRVSDDLLAMRVGFTLAGVVIMLIVSHVIFEHLHLASGRNDGFASKLYGLVILSGDQSLSESFNHGMLFFAAILFVLANYETQSRLALFLAALFAFAWLDDSSQYHERMGAIFVENLNLPSAFGLRALDFGELLAWALATALLSLLGVWAYRGRRNGDRLVLRLISLPLAALFVSAVFFDMIHIMVQGNLANRLLTILEDGGEMLAVAAIATIALAVARNPRRIWRHDQT